MTDPVAGSMADRPFESADECAISALDEINPLSITKNVEFAGRVYQKSDKFFFTRPVKGTRDDSLAPPTPIGTKKVGTYHTHAGNFDTTDEVFSPQDMWKAILAKEYSWLETPYQRIIKFTPAALCTDGVFDAAISGKLDVLRNVYVLRKITILGSAP